MGSRRQRLGRDERGAILIQVGLAMLTLMGFTVFVCDYGVVWVSRGQAQNAADAGAMAGALARGFDEFTNAPSAGGSIELAARNTAQANLIWGQPGVVPAPTFVCPTGVLGGGCVRVEVYRDDANGNPLPVFFGPILGITSQGTRATATAQAGAANATRCMKPWALADKWAEAGGAPWTQFDAYAPLTGDTYTPPYGTPGTGFSKTDASGFPIDIGYQVALKFGAPAGTIPAGLALSVDLPNGSGGVSPYEANMSGCTSATIGVAPQGDLCSAADVTKGCLLSLPPQGALTDAGVAAIVAADPGAYWDIALKKPVNSAVLGLSPRVVPVALFDTDNYALKAGTASDNVVKIVNIVGFFVEGMCGGSFVQEGYVDCSVGNTVVGRLTPFPGLTLTTAGAINPPNAFGVMVQLVR